MVRILFLFCLHLFVWIAIAQEGIQHYGFIPSRVASGNWQPQSTGATGKDIDALSAVDRNVCWLAGESGTIIYTTDGGLTWLPANPGIIDTQHINVIEGLSDSISFVSTTQSDTTYIYRTTDIGATWARVFSQYGGHIDGIKMFDKGAGIAIGDPVGGRWTILKTRDGGSSWDRIAAEPIQILGRRGGIGFGSFDTSYFWFYDQTGRSYSSNDGGETWRYSVDSSTENFGPWLRWMNARDLMLVVGGEQVFGYHNGWFNGGGLPVLYTPATGLVGATSTSEFWLVQDAVYYTSTFGNQWTSQPPNGLDRPAHLIDMVTLGAEVTGWAIGSVDTVYRYSQSLTGIDEEAGSRPRTFSFYQNYPNPFNPTTVIQFEVPTLCFVSIRVYNMLGEELATLMNEWLTPGSYHVTWDAHGLSSGVYFCQLNAGSFISTLKLVLVR